MDVVIGPAVHVDRDALVHSLGRGDRCTFAGDDGELLDAIASAGREGRGLVISPGENELARDARDAAEAAACPVVWIDPGACEGFEIAIRDRGLAGYRFGVRWLRQRLELPFDVVPYGAEPDQLGDLRLPHAGDAPFPVVVLLHGGFWRERWQRDTIEPIAIDLTRRGFATWNLEYRRVGPHGGGWPSTCHDVAAGIDRLVELAVQHPLDLGHVTFVGHSAGAQLALWAVARHGASAARVRPGLVVALAGICDLEEAARRSLGSEGNATADFMGGLPDERREAYAAASPLRALPLGVPQIVVQGGRDDIAGLVELSRAYARAVEAAGDPVDLFELPDADHFDVIDPTSEGWTRVAAQISGANGGRSLTRS
ncbi:MAG TPA: alpha/beta hydrolase [Gaiellales bacterium]